MDRYEERPARVHASAVAGNSEGHAAMQAHATLEANESVSRIVSFASPYIFWLTVFSLSLGILWLQ